MKLVYTVPEFPVVIVIVAVDIVTVYTCPVMGVIVVVVAVHTPVPVAQRILVDVVYVFSVPEHTNGVSAVIGHEFNVHVTPQCVPAFNVTAALPDNAVITYAAGLVYEIVAATL